MDAEASASASFHLSFALSLMRTIAMTTTPQSLRTELQTALTAQSMIEIDGLHAFEFALDEDDNLHIECIDGRAAKHWEFTPAQVAAATFDQDLQSWLIVGFASDTKTVGEHRLVCLGDVLSSADDEDETE